MFLLYDRAGLSQARLSLTPEAMYLVSLMDGENSLLALKEEYEAQTGAGTDIDTINAIIADLDAAYFLENHNFQSYFTRLKNEFLHTLIREASCAGSAYSAETATLADNLEEIIQQAPRSEEEGRVSNAYRPAPRGVIAPHMDFTRAGSCYGQVYRELRQYAPPRTVIILGTAHQPIRNRFAVCAKNFAIPGGIIKYDTEITERIIEECRLVADFTLDTFAHRLEHSIELQLVWLRHIWGDNFRIVSVLTGPVAEYVHAPEKAQDDRQLSAMITALRATLRHGGVTLLASADLSHIGPRYDDTRRVTPDFLRETENADREYLTALKTAPALESLRVLQRHSDQYHICSIGCLYVFRAVLEDVAGRLLGYRLWHDNQMQQAVSCAGLLYE